jgi:hypothetical protein
MRNKAALIGIGGLALLMLAFIGQLDSFFVYMPVIMRQPTPTPTSTATPTVTPTPTVTRTQVPCPAGTPVATQFFNSRGVVGIYFRMKDNRNCFNPNEEAWFQFKIINTNANTIRIAGLGAHYCTSNPPGWRCTQASWGDFDLAGTSAGGDANVIEWEDHLNMPYSGQLQVRLAICWLSSRAVCEDNPTQWDYLSNAFPITIR